jgi:hypothetical protein
MTLPLGLVIGHWKLGVGYWIFSEVSDIQHPRPNCQGQAKEEDLLAWRR